ncbi:OmpA family protein [Budvicia diplopodorum]|uniref:OmpA family protein n=1 Tax=Budvicia diplopodorum TaxID=1119056 RepID=UPI001FEB0BA7|nr:OmpA family protein [Budvicia diplopodorum]
MKVPLQRGLWLWAGLLMVLLCLLFLPLTPTARGVSVFVVMVAVIAGMVRAGRRPVNVAAQQLAGLPEEPYRLPVVLICGDMAGWPADIPVHQTSQGCWLKVDDSRELCDVVRQLLWLRPAWAVQLAVMVSLRPQQQSRNEALAPWLHELRWQLTRLRRDTQHDIPLLLSSQTAGQYVCESLWQTLLPGEPVQVWQDGRAPCAVTIWAAQDQLGTRLQQQMMLNTQADWFTQNIIPAFTAENPDVPPVLPYAVLLRQTRDMPGAQGASVWQDWLQQRTSITQVTGWYPATADDNAASALPDFLLPLLPKGHGTTPAQRAVRLALTLFTLATVVALCSSGWNNRQLVHHVAFDIQHYYAVAMNNYDRKAKAVETLGQDAGLLNDWSRNGESLRLSLGLYRGERLRLPLLDAIKTYVPPPPPPPAPQTPQIVRFDSMSLFDVGKWQLKSDSTKVLVNALVNIKVKPGWLIVVAGHTDDTGDDKSNQILSLKRAESVRDWMRDTGEVSESCFAVQGYGENRPLKSNDAEAGRAANRRVEISLVPQADACQAASKTASPEQG